jgi:hypothetical protein
MSILLMAVFLFTTCTQEPLNKEADITEITIPDMPAGMIIGSPTIHPSLNTSEIVIEVKGIYQPGMLSPQFVLTAGATISPASGTTLDFSDEKEQHYTVTGEDGKWKRTYTIVVRPQFVRSEFNYNFDLFEKYNENHASSYKFDVFYELTPTGAKEYIWGSGNQGFALTGGSAAADKYPTYATTDSKSGTAVCLVTRSTGAFGALANMPIAAGNIFLGTFDASSAMKDPMKATRFGIPHTVGEPQEVTFWYKFLGGSYTDKVTGETVLDWPSMYAVLFEPEIDANGNIVLLDGLNVLTAPNIISAAQMKKEDIVRSETTVKEVGEAEFTFASIPFIPRREFDYQKLINGNYYITIVFSSSYKGDTFEGYVGNTLIVDEVRLITKTAEE